MKVLWVHYAFLTYVDQNRVSPQIALGTEGENVNLLCTSSSKVIWYYNDGSLPNNAKYDTNTDLVIKNIVKANEGTYECRGMTEKKEQFHGKIIIHVRSK